VGLAQAILHRPKLLILDEPTVGLDPSQIIEIRHLIKRLAEHSTILFSTHILTEVEALCDRAIILMNGQVSADAKLADLAASADALLVLQQDSSDAETALAALDHVQSVSKEHNGYTSYRIHSRQDLMPEIFQLAKAKNWSVRELRHETRTLETVFNELMEAKTNGGQ
jgi:ABC-2 type transport system ATP-binding protein